MKETRRESGKGNPPQGSGERKSLFTGVTLDSGSDDRIARKEAERSQRYEKARTGEFSLEEQLSEFLELSDHTVAKRYLDSSGILHERMVVEPDARRELLITPESRISIRRINRPLGEIEGVVHGYAIRRPVDCLEISDIEVRGDTLAPLEDFVRTAARLFQGEAINFEEVTDPEIIEWCQNNGWVKHEKSSNYANVPPDYYKSLSPFSERQNIITTTWERTGEIPPRSKRKELPDK